MSDKEIPQYIRSLPTNLGFNFVLSYKLGQDAIATLTPDKYSEVLGLTIELATKEFMTGKLESAVSLFLTVVQLSEKINDYGSLVVTFSNLGIAFQNVRIYDVSLAFAKEGYRIAVEHNLLELKLKVLKVISLVYTNTQQREKRMEVMEEVAETHGKLGQMDKKAEIEGLIKRSREFMAILDK